ncbi:MAG: dispase autolysis-inducing protein [Polyangiaceae bacterium]|nr:dispase autolysis-inducing protein [Polyangiaceae bacterium]
MRAYLSIFCVAFLATATGCGDDTGPGGEGGAIQGGGGSAPAGGTGGVGGGTGGADQGGGGGDVGGEGGSGGGESWIVPTCTTIEGTGAVTYTTDKGATMAPTSEPITGVTYTYGLVPTSTPNELLATSGGRLLHSTDAGCSWTDAGEVPLITMRLTAGASGGVYGWYESEPVLVRVDGGVVQTLESPGGVMGLGVDPTDGDHLRMVDGFGVMHESFDGGLLWDKIGDGMPEGTGLYAVAFDPGDIDHVVAGLIGDGALFTFDGGLAWTASEGLGEGAVNAFAVSVSPANPLVVWLEGYDLGTEVGQEIRRVWRSDDGGATFAGVIEDGGDVHLTNGLPMAPHPTDEDILFFEFGTYFQGYGTDLFEYDHQTGEIAVTHSDHDDILVMSFHPTDPAVLYLGLTSQEISAK